MAARPAIASTVRNAGHVLDSFIRHHRAIGFARIYLFFDDPADPDIATFAEYDGVVCTPVDDALRRRWRGAQSWARFGAHIDTDLMARQTLNCEYALSLARADGCDWLLHIDCDEAFHAPDATPSALFDALARDGVEQAVFHNLEALPERADIVDYFREATLFKVNFAFYGAARYTEEQLALAARASFAHGGPNWFNAYDNGKAATRIDAGLIPHGVHIFQRLENGAPAPSRNRAVGEAAAILHYPKCGLRNFNAKYAMMGAFSDKWFGEVEAPLMHRKSRDIFARGDADAIERFYRENFMAGPGDDVDAMLAAGVLKRITAVADGLSERDAD